MLIVSEWPGRPYPTPPHPTLTLQNDKMNGRGIMSYADGKRYEVEYELGVEIRRRPLVQVGRWVGGWVCSQFNATRPAVWVPPP